MSRASIRALARLRPKLEELKRKIEIILVLSWWPRCGLRTYPAVDRLRAIGARIPRMARVVELAKRLG